MLARFAIVRLQRRLQLLRLVGQLLLLLLQPAMFLLQRLVHILLLGMKSLQRGVLLRDHGFLLLGILQLVLQLLRFDRLFSHPNRREHRQTRYIEMRIGLGNAVHQLVYAAGHLLHVLRAAAYDFIRSAVYFHTHANSALVTQNYVPPSVLGLDLRCLL